MLPAIQSVLAGLPVLAVHFAATLALLVAGIALYVLVTPYHEVRLIRAGNAAAGVTLMGAVVGYAIPLAATLARSVSVADIAVWGVVVAVLQIAAFGVVSLVLRRLSEAIERGEVGAALVLASAQIAIGLINAAAIAG